MRSHEWAYAMWDWWFSLRALPPLMSPAEFVLFAVVLFAAFVGYLALKGWTAADA